MNLEKLVKALIIFNLLIVIAMVYVVPEDPAYLDTPFTYFDIAGLFYIVLWVASQFLLFKFYPSSRSFFTVMVVLSVPIGIGMTELTVATGNTYDLVTWLNGVIDGALLAILYLTNLNDRFNRLF